VKTSTIRLPDVEAAMLLEVQKRNKTFVELDALLARLISAEFCKQKGKKLF